MINKIETILENTKVISENKDVDLISEYLGENYKKYRLAWNAANINNVPSFPIHLDLEFYDICNQSCTFCPRNEQVHKNLPYEINTKTKINENLIDKIILECKEQKLMSVNFGAFAEPLVYKNIFQVVKKFKDIGVIDSRIITNALLLDKYIDVIFDSGLVNLYISLDAFSEQTYMLQRGKGYKKVIDNILYFLEEKKKRKSILPITRVSFVETNENLHELDEFVEFWKSRVDHVDLQKKIDYTKKPDLKYQTKQWNCIDPFRRMSVISDGSILPCCSFWGRALKIGNIAQMRLKEAWNSEGMDKIRKELIEDKSSICSVCQSSN